MYNSLRVAALAALLPAAAAAQSVGILHGQGQGLMFTHRGNCYAIMPKHVVGDEIDLSFDAGTADKGGGRAFRIDPVFDLALAHVYDGFNGRCQFAFTDLPTRTDAIIERQPTVDVVRVYGTGGVTRERATVRDLQPDFLEVELAPDADRLFEGTSGAMIYAGDVPVAMAIEAVDATRAKALRIDTIIERVARILEGREAAPPETPARSRPAASAVPFRLVSCSIEPVDPARSCITLVGGEAAAVFPPGSLNLVIDLDLTDADGAPARVRGIELRSAPAGGAETSPRRVTVTTSATGKDRGAWPLFAAKDMAVTGSLSAERPQPVLARRMRIVVSDAWDDDLPVRIDSIALR